MTTSRSASHNQSARPGGRHARSRRGLRLRHLALVAVATGAFVVVGIAPEAHAAVTITVNPDTNLPTDGASNVEVIASGLTPDATVQIQECATKPGIGECDGLSNDQANNDGTFNTANGTIDQDVAVTYVLPGDGALCDSDPDPSKGVSCAINLVYVSAPTPGEIGQQGITFQGHDGPTSPNAALTVTASPTAPLQVTADASASTPGISPITEYFFNFGDDLNEPGQTSPTLVHTFTQAGSYDVSVTVESADNTFSTTDKSITVPASTPPPPPPATATKLAFATQPVDTTVGAPMKNPDGTTTDVQVLAQNADGSTDTKDNGTAVLTLGGGTAGAQFVGGGTTLTKPFANGVADFTGIAVNTEGFRYTLTASSGNLTPATSNPFDVATNATACPAGQSCTVTATSAGTGQSAVITAAPGPGAIVTASFGGNVAPLNGCTTTAPGILTFNGNRQKTVKLTIATNRLILKFCYGQPTPFIDITLHKTKLFNAANQEYEGILAPCIGKLIPPPCISALSVSRTSETVTVIGGPGDPRISH
jgi:PKD domain